MKLLRYLCALFTRAPDPGEPIAYTAPNGRRYYLARGRRYYWRDEANQRQTRLYLLSNKHCPKGVLARIDSGRLALFDTETQSAFVVAPETALEYKRTLRRIRAARRHHADELLRVEPIGDPTAIDWRPHYGNR